MASLLFLKYTKHTPLSGILSKLSLNLKCPFPWCPHTVFESLLKHPLVHCCNLEDFVLQISSVVILTPEMIVLEGVGAFARYLGLEGGAVMNGIIAFMK